LAVRKRKKVGAINEPSASVYPGPRPPKELEKKPKKTFPGY